MSVQELTSHIEINRDRILAKTLNHSIIPQGFRCVEIPKSNGKAYIRSSHSYRQVVATIHLPSADG
ncbi:MAG: hypothetical protein ACJAVA_002040 [Flavobacteriaceae bacterium]|jgi:hypothetical protein